MIAFSTDDTRPRGMVGGLCLRQPRAAAPQTAPLHGTRLPKTGPVVSPRTAVVPGFRSWSPPV